MALETLNPTAHDIDGDVINPTLAYDGKNWTYATVQTTTTGEASTIRLYAFPADSEPGNRDTVELWARMEWETLDTNDLARLLARPINASEPWTEIAEWFYPDTFATPAFVDFDVTALMGSAPATGWEVGVFFFNGPGVPPPPPEFEL